MSELVQLLALLAALAAVVYGFRVVERFGTKVIEHDGKGLVVAKLIALALVVLVAGLMLADPTGTITAISNALKP